MLENICLIAAAVIGLYFFIVLLIKDEEFRGDMAGIAIVVVIMIPFCLFLRYVIA